MMTKTSEERIDMFLRILKTSPIKDFGEIDLDGKTFGLNNDDGKILFDMYPTSFSLFGKNGVKIKLFTDTVKSITEYGVRGCKERNIKVTPLEYWVYCINRPPVNVRDIEQRKSVMASL